MAGPVKYLSGRQNKLKIGIPDYLQETTTLQVFGRVGIGTTNATSDLYVKGGGEFTGVVTATKFDGAFENITLTGVTTTQQFNTTIIESETINITGISTFGDIVNLIGSQSGITSISFAPSTNTITFLDSAKAKFGDSGDMQVYFDGTDANVETEQGTLYLKTHAQTGGSTGSRIAIGDTSVVVSPRIGETAIEAYANQGVKLLYDNESRFETIGTGVTVKGTLNVSGVSTFVGALDIDDSIDVDGQTQLDAVNVAGVSTFGAAVDINADVNLDDNTLNIDYAAGTPSGSVIRVNTVAKDVDLIRLSGASNDITMDSGDSVSYTHLTLPTKRIV